MVDRILSLVDTLGPRASRVSEWNTGRSMSYDASVVLILSIQIYLQNCLTSSSIHSDEQ